MIKLGANISSLTAQRNLGKATTALSQSFERLSSGLRINHASDDPAGLAMASGLQTQGRLSSQALRNVNDGISALAIADGALQELSQIAARQSELAEQAANGVCTLAQRQAMNTEANALVDEFNRIVSTTKFNGTSLLDGTLGELRIQAGTGGQSVDQISSTVGEALKRTCGDGTFGASSSFGAGSLPFDLDVGDVDRNGTTDIVIPNCGSSSLSLLLGNGDGTFKAQVSVALPAAAVGSVIADLNNDGKLDIAAGGYGTTATYVLLGNGDGTFNAAAVYQNVAIRQLDVVAVDLNRDGRLDLVTANASTASISMLLGNGDGTFGAARSIAGLAQPTAIDPGDFNADGAMDIFVSCAGVATSAVLLSNGDGTFKAPIQVGAYASYDADVADINGDGILDIASAQRGSASVATFLGRGDGTFSLAASYYAGDNPAGVEIGDLNGDGIPDLFSTDIHSGAWDGNTAYVFIGKGDGTFSRDATYTTPVGPGRTRLADFNSDGVLDSAVAAETDGRLGILLGHSHSVTSIARLDLLSVASACSSLGIISQTQSRVSAELGAVGAAQSRLGVAANTLIVAHENFSAAYDRISSADVAEEVTNMVRQQILQQAAAAVLAQANQQPALVMQLLKG